MSDRIAIVAARRTPIGRFLGGFRNRTAVELGIDAARAVIASNGIAAHIDSVFFGNARQAGGGPNPARQVSVGSGLGHDVPACTINAACGSGMQSIALAADAIRLGNAAGVLAGGTENMTRVPFMLDRARTGYRLGNDRLIDGMYRDGFDCPLANMVMGATAENLADDYGITRREQDEWAAMSQNRVEAAVAANRFDDEMVAVSTVDDRRRAVVVDADEHPRKHVTVESLGKLRAVFRADGTVTAGNASGITDGAAAVVVMSEQSARRWNLEPLGFIRGFAVAGVDPTRMGIGPVPATRMVLEQTGVRLGDVDLIELNEAFAAQVIACDRELHFDRDRVNVNGGSISLGHPIGCTGARIVVTLLHEMKRRDASLGLATLCVSGGLGMSMLIERC